MFYRILADLVVLIHVVFVLFALLGGILVLRQRFWGWVHVPAVLWAAGIAVVGGGAARSRPWKIGSVRGAVLPGTAPVLSNTIFFRSSIRLS